MVSSSRATLAAPSPTLRPSRRPSWTRPAALRPPRPPRGLRVAPTRPRSAALQPRAALRPSRRPSQRPRHLTCGPATISCGPAALTCGPRRPRLRPRRPYLRPRRSHLRTPPPLLAVPATLDCGLAALTCGPAALTCGPRCPYLRSRRPQLRPRRPYLRPRRPYLRTPPPLPTVPPPSTAASPPSLAALPPFPAASSPAAAPPTTQAARATSPSRAADCRAARQPSSRAAHLLSSRAALQPSRPAAVLPCRRAAQQPSRPAAEPPSRPATEQPSRPEAEPLCSRAAVLPYLRAVRAAPSAIDFDGWVDDLQLFLQCDRADGLSLFDLTPGASPAPPADADATVRSQWATRNAAARLAVRRHLPTSERAHFSQYKSAQTFYDTVVARYSSPATAALSRLLLPYLFRDLAAFSTVADLITHLRTSDTRYRAALPADLCAKNPPPMYITLYYIVTRLPDSLRVVRDHFLSVSPTTLTVDLLENLGSGSVSWRATRSSSVLRSSCEAEIYAGAMAAQELCWFTYLLTDLGEPPRSPPVLYVDNKAMLALCREQRLEHRTKHIALCYFLARELQQLGQLRLAYVASEANTADVFTKALAPCDHQRFCTQLGLVPVLPHLLTS
ncbi:unnamed protein product [Closterium sp. NIES-53]